MPAVVTIIKKPDTSTSQNNAHKTTLLILKFIVNVLHTMIADGN